MMDLAVTVTAKSPGRYAADARLAAEAWGLPYVERERKSALEPLLGRVARAFLVLGGDGWTLHDASGELRYSPGLAQIRIKRLMSRERGEPADDDVLLRLGELRAGDSVLDCTLGLGADALVCEHRVGPTGRVTGIESSKALYALASTGLRRSGSKIEVVSGKAADVMRRELKSGSFDCVIIDAMFDRPKRASPSFEILRRHADHSPLDEVTIAEARRVARRWVVIKGSRYGKDFARLGLTPVPLTHEGPLIWARLPGAAAGT